MIVQSRPQRRAGNLGLQADRGGPSGMGIARPRCSAESLRHRPPTSSPQRVSVGRERVTRRQTPCSHWTLGQRPPAAAHAWPSESVTRCRQVPKGSEATVTGDSLTPPAPHSAAAPMVCNVPAPATVGMAARTSAQRRAKCAQNPPHNNRHGRERHMTQSKETDGRNNE